QLYDTMRGRVIFPIHNLSGRVLGFGARIMTSDKKRPKYINSAESDIYHKGKVLYGLYFAKSAIASLDNCYLVEGYTDVISMHQAGVHNVIASSGTALGTEQIRLISRYTSNITLLFDGDKAGIKAAFRGINMILEEGMNVRLVLFPDGEDPDSYARKYRPAEVKSFIEDNALDFISFKTNLLLEETKNDPIKKAGLIREIAETIALIPEPIARTLYVQQCSGLMQIDEKLLFTEINKLRRKKSLEKSGSHSHPRQDYPQDLPAGDSTEPRPVLQPTLDYQEKDVIRIMLLYGHREIMVEGLNEDDRPVQIAMKVASYIVQDFEEDEMRFENAACQAIYDICREAAAGVLPDDDQHLSTLVLNHDTQEVRQLAIDLVTTQHTLSHNWEQRHQIFVKTEEEDVKSLVEEVVHSLKLKILEKRIEENQKMMKQEQDHEKIMQLMEIERNLKILRSACARQLSLVVTR
ncbi:MAG: toprim domain-containing protein, partial [Bacteroidales bacterium]